MYFKKEAVEILMQQELEPVREKKEKHKKANIFLKKRKPVMIVAGVLLVALLMLVYHLRQYHDFAEMEAYPREDGTETSYMDFQGNLLKYSRDGAFYTKYNGDLIWNYTYEMSNPETDACGSYMLIYDRKGTQASILTATGFKQTIKTAIPIVDANISSQGTVAILMQEESTGYLQMFDSEGELLASGELHMENNGYPIAMDISQDGEEMVVSQLDMRGGSIKTTIAFYNFGKDGKDKVDNMIANYSYSNQIFPEVRFMDNGKAVAFGDGEIVLFHNNAKASVEKEIFLEGEINSIFFNEKYFGVICNATDEKGKPIGRMNVYSQNGHKKCSRNVGLSYTGVEMLSNHDIMLSNGKDIVMYNRYGIKKFAYHFDTGIYKIIARGGAKQYYFIREKDMVRVRLK